MLEGTGDLDRIKFEIEKGGEHITAFYARTDEFLRFEPLTSQRAPGHDSVMQAIIEHLSKIGKTAYPATLHKRSMHLHVANNSLRSSSFKLYVFVTA